VSALQLACRHPGLSTRMYDRIEGIARQFQTAVVERHPDTAEILEMGWDSQFDR
jgi:hypothetical protein